MKICRRKLTLAVIPLIAACAATAPADETENADARESAYAGLGTDPETWREFWSALYSYELSAPIEQIAPAPPFEGTRTVLLVPGTTIGPEFFEPMRARLQRDGFAPVIWAPDDLFTGSLWIGAERIGDRVAQVLAERGEARLHVVAECDGGVAARYYAQVLGGSTKIDQLVTFVSAHHGSYAAPTGSWFTGWPALGDIKPGSAFLATLNGWPTPPDLKLTSIYTCWDEYLWPYSTSRVEGATNVEFCDEYIGHFDGFWNADVYHRILLTLRGTGADAPTWY